MNIKDLITKVDSLGIQLDRPITPETIRKLSSDELISRPPRSSTSGSKGKGAPSDWPEDAVAEIAAYLCVRNLRRNTGGKIHKSIIKEVRKVGKAILKAPNTICSVGVDEDDDFYLDCCHDFVHELLKKPKRIPRQSESTSEVSGKEVILGTLLADITDYFFDLIELQKLKPNCFHENDPPHLNALLEEIDYFVKIQELDKKPPLQFTVIPELATWIATQEKLKRAIPLSQPICIWYNWNVYVLLKKKPPQSYFDYDPPNPLESPLLNAAPDAQQNDSEVQTGSEPDFSFVQDEPIIDKVEAGGDVNTARSNQDSVNVQYHIKLSYLGGAGVEYPRKRSTAR